MIAVDIADRLYDYSDEEKAARVIAEYQIETGIDDQSVITLWHSTNDPRRLELERRVFDAIDRNGSVKRAETSIPNDMSLSVVI